MLGIAVIPARAGGQMWGKAKEKKNPSSEHLEFCGKRTFLGLPRGYREVQKPWGSRAEG